jgi:CRP/FNR family cyclic AMP-dependent transcriptional regulator
VLTRNAKLRLLKHVAFFSGCSKQELEALSDVLTETVIEEGTNVVREGDDTREFYVIVSGTAEVFRGAVMVRTLGAGEFFGEVATLFNARRSATVRAASKLHVLVSDEPGFFRLIHEAHGLHRKVIDALAQRLAPTAL